MCSEPHKNLEVGRDSTYVDVLISMISKYQIITKQYVLLFNNFTFFIYMYLFLFKFFSYFWYLTFKHRFFIKKTTRGVIFRQY